MGEEDIEALPLEEDETQPGKSNKSDIGHRTSDIGHQASDILIFTCYNNNMNIKIYGLICWILLMALTQLNAQSGPAKSKAINNSGDQYQYLTYDQLVTAFKDPPESAKPWVFWYWMQASVSKEGITADLEAMKYAGIGGAYLMPIKDTTSPPLMQPVIRQMTPEWWAMMKFALEEADRLGLKIAMHVSDGFALAGGPWITPELSMQKLVWSQVQVDGGKGIENTLPLPVTNGGYYKDVAVYAYPSRDGETQTTKTEKPKVTTSTGGEASFLVEANNNQNFSSAENCWIQYAFETPFTCRSIIVRTKGNNYQAQRLLVELSDDGVHFRRVGRLHPPRHGWQDTDEPVTHSIEPVTARYFRFVYDKPGSEPGAEDLDAAKWKPSLKVSGIELSGAATIHQFEGKNGSVWRVSAKTTEAMVPKDACIPLDRLTNITQYLAPDGHLKWEVPAGKWTIIRMGHASTGHTNATGGGGKGLECDKFNPGAIKLQFENWFGEAIKQAGPDLTAKVLKVFHIDSWECGSQNWSPVFRSEFISRRGYDPLLYLPVMAGIPVESADFSERFLYDVRQTISELIVDVFYRTMASLAKAEGCTFSAESVAPTMLSDGMLHYKTVDIPMGEFWLRSPTHDKPNDMLDAISGAHIYGKPIIQAEAFTELRMAWDEHPGMLKTLQDRNYALGINRLVYHVFTHNPWMDRKPGMTLDGVGLYFQRDQTWWKLGRAWVDYARRCQALLQVGKPVTDIAVFTGEEYPRRSLLPDRLVASLPGIIGTATVHREADRLANKGEPLRELPEGVSHSANMVDPEDWIDPLHGYAYDSFNPDALKNARVKNHKIVLDGGASYQLLVIPGKHPMSPNNDAMSVAVAGKLFGLVNNGATLVIQQPPVYTLGLLNTEARDGLPDSQVAKIFAAPSTNIHSAGINIPTMKPGKGRIIHGPYTAGTFDALNIPRDVIVTGARGEQAGKIAWTHREAPGLDIYFISNQADTSRMVDLSLRVSGKVPELWDAVNGTIQPAREWEVVNNRTIIPVKLDAGGSVFVVFSKPSSSNKVLDGQNWVSTKPIIRLEGPWKVQFDTSTGGPLRPVTFNKLSDWSGHADTAIRYYSGTAIYSLTFDWKPVSKNRSIGLDLGEIANIAGVQLNGKDCGVVWTAPYRVDITRALKTGKNELVIEVANTWANRIIGDQRLQLENRVTNTTAPIRIGGKPLVPAGLLGPVRLVAY